jgi:hypothetical protein
MDKLLLHAAVFAVFTLVVYLVCMWFVRLEERERDRAGSKRRS